MTGSEQAVCEEKRAGRTEMRSCEAGSAGGAEMRSCEAGSAGGAEMQSCEAGSAGGAEMQSCEAGSAGGAEMRSCEAGSADNAEKQICDSKQVMELALQAGHILLENGAEIFRVEETIDRICHYYGSKSGNAFVLSNGIFMTAGNEKESFFAKVQHIPVSGTHLDKVAAVNQLSREIEQGMHTLESAQAELERIKKMQGKRNWVQIAASGLGSAAFCCLFGGGLTDSLIAFAAGLILYVYVLYLSVHLSKIVGNVLGGLLVTMFCSGVHLLGFGSQLNSMIIGSMMPMIPGVAFTNAIREIADADYISGTVRMMDALVGFLSIAIGVGLGTVMIGMI